MADDDNLDLEEGGAEEEVANEGKKKKLSVSPMLVKILMITAAILVMALMSGLIAFLVSKSVSKAVGVEGGISDDMVKQDPSNYYQIVPEFNVNTADLDVARYVRVSIVLTYTGNAKKLAVELPNRTFLMRDKISTILSSYTYDTLRHNEGKAELKEEIKRTVNSMLKNGQIDDVLFDNFLLS